MPWPCTDRDHPGSALPARPASEQKHGREGQVLPGRVPAADRADRLGIPFVLSTGRTLYHYNSAGDDDARAGRDRRQQQPFFEISAEDASALGLADGELSRLVSRRGSLEAHARVTDRVYPGLVWMALHFAQAKVNWLTHDVGDSLIGTPEYKVSAVRIERAEPGSG